MSRTAGTPPSGRSTRPWGARTGRLLGIYPEGTRAPDCRLHKGHTGVARLSLHCDVPIIPVGSSAPGRSSPRGAG